MDEMFYLWINRMRHEYTATLRTFQNAIIAMKPQRQFKKLLKSRLTNLVV